MLLIINEYLSLIGHLSHDHLSCMEKCSLTLLVPSACRTCALFHSVFAEVSVYFLWVYPKKAACKKKKHLTVLGFSKVFFF